MHVNRVAVKADNVRDGKWLVTQNADAEGYWDLRPGGGQEPGEPLPVALQRECGEEVGVDVDVDELLFVRDYVGRNHEFARQDGEEHALELMFACAIREGQEPCNGPLPDASQIGVVWLDLIELDNHRLYPRALKRALAEPRGPGAMYLGDVN